MHRSVRLLVPSADQQCAKCVTSVCTIFSLFIMQYAVGLCTDEGYDLRLVGSQHHPVDSRGEKTSTGATATRFALHLCLLCLEAAQSVSDLLVVISVQFIIWVQV